MDTKPTHLDDTTRKPVQKPIRVLFIDHTSKVGGAEVAMFNLVLHLNTDHYAPIILLFEEGALAEKFRPLAPTFVIPLESSIGEASKDKLGAKSLLKLGSVFSLLAFIIRISKFVRKHEIDLVHTQSLKSDIIGGIAARLAFRPIIWHVRDRITGDYLPQRVVSVFRALGKIIPTHTIGPSAAVVKTLIPISENEEIPHTLKISRRFSVVHDGTKVESAILRQSVEIRKFGLIGRISPWKGQDIFVRAAAQVHKSHPDARFVIIGSALFGEEEYERRVKLMTHELGLNEVVEFAGYCTNVPEQIAKLDVVVHASTIGEPFGQVIIEGMAAAKPVIATQGGGVPEIIEDGVSGILVTMGDSAGLAYAMNWMTEHPEGAFEIGRRGRERVEKAFRIELTAANVEAVYARVLSPRR